MKKTRNGYTLIELLIVMVVLVTVGVIVAGIIVSSLRGTNKATTIETVRKNGNYAILQISRMIEFAQSFGGVSLNGSSYSTLCPSQNSPSYKYLKIISFDNGQTIFSCSSNTISSGSASLINTALVTAPTSTCYFTCLRSGIYEPPTIGIDFTLSQQGSSNLFENKYIIPFETTVQMRNLNK